MKQCLVGRIRQRKRQREKERNSKEEGKERMMKTVKVRQRIKKCETGRVAVSVQFKGGERSCVYMHKNAR